MRAEEIVKYQLTGVVNTPSIFMDSQILGVLNFNPELHGDNLVDKFNLSNLETPDNLRFGKAVEILFERYLENINHVHVLAKNLQIINDGITLGELDYLFENQIDGTINHLELTFKFYLYDPGLNDAPLGNWIGPNRNDKLIDKIGKLKKQQLPLINRFETVESLKNLGIKTTGIRQQVCFKAMLFLPYKLKSISVTPLNPKCISGYWILWTDFNTIQDREEGYLIVEKKYWMCSPTDNLEWYSYPTVINQIKSLIEQRRSPLLWKKNKEGKYERFFVVWWE